MFLRLFALPYFLLVCLLTLLPMTSAQAVGLPGMLGSSDKAQAQPTEPLGQSLDEVIKNLENDQQRSKLLADLKKLRDATKKAQPEAEIGVLGLIGSHSLAGRIRADSSSLARERSFVQREVGL